MNSNDKTDDATLYEAILEEIYDGRLVGGQRLKVSELAARFGTTSLKYSSFSNLISSVGSLTIHTLRQLMNWNQSRRKFGIRRTAIKEHSDSWICSSIGSSAVSITTKPLLKSGEISEHHSMFRQRDYGSAPLASRPSRRSMTI